MLDEKKLPEQDTPSNAGGSNERELSIAFGTPYSTPLFLQHELADLQELVQDARADGALYAGDPDGYPVLRKEDVEFLKTDFDAAEYKYENTTDRDMASVVILDRFEEIIDRQIGLQEQIDHHFPAARLHGASNDQEMEM